MSKRMLYETTCKVVEIDNQIALCIVVKPFDDLKQASECAEYMRETFSELLKNFFEGEGHKVQTIPDIIKGQRVQ